MARGFDQHQQRVHALAGLGKELSRRARSRCELCGDSTSLEVVEVPPATEEPDPDRAVMVCARCRPAVDGGRMRGEPDTWRFLAEAVWSETAPVQVAAVRATRRLAEEGVDWAREALDGLFLDEAIEARI